MIHLAAILVAANLSLGIVKEYFIEAHGADYQKLKEEDFMYFYSQGLCDTIEHHFWNKDQLLYVVVLDKDGVVIKYIESDSAYKNLKPDLDQIHCIGN